MRVEIEYASKIFEECPSNYDLTKITDDNEVKFIKWMAVLQGTTTTLAYEIKVFNYYNGLYILNDTFKKYYNVFFCTLLENLSACISIDFAKLIKKQNKMCVQNLRNEYRTMQHLFIFMDYNTCFEKIKKPFKSVCKNYDTYYEVARNQIFAHTDLILLNEEELIKTMNKSLNDITNKMLNDIQTVLNTIWYAYSGHDLCYSLANDEDYKDIAKILCEKHGNTKFINL